MIRGRPCAYVLGVLWVVSGGAHADGDFGHKVLGTVGLDAGSQQSEGVYVGDRYLNLSVDRLVNRYGKTIPIKGLSMEGFANVFGVSGTFKLGEGPYLSSALAVPVSGLHLKTEVPYSTLDRFGLGDIFIQPLMLGWRFPRLDITSSYSIYAPTGQINRKGYSQSQWSQQVSVGGTVFFDDERSLRISALTSYNIFGRKLNLDVTQGDQVQIQGGVGGRFFKIMDVGMAGYAMWQVAADTGSALPPRLRGQSEYAVGLGPELGVTIPQLRSKLIARYEWEIASRSRPEGQILMVSLSMLAWRPDD